MNLRWLLALLFLLPANAAPAGRERWVYLPTNFQVDENAGKIIALLERSAKAGYTHALVADSKFSRLATVASNYAPNVEKVKAAAKRLGIEMVPSVFPVGYSNDMLFHDPNLAEGLPVQGATFFVKDGIATRAPALEPMLPGGKMDDLQGWGFIDDSITVADGSAHSAATEANARLHRKIDVIPFNQYHVSVRIRTAGFSGGLPEIKVIGDTGRQLQWTNLKVVADQDWTGCDVTFNALDDHKVGLYIGVWGGHRGDLWWDDAVVEPCGPVNLVIRPGAPFKVFEIMGKEVSPGRYEVPANSATGTDPWPGEFKPWHEPLKLKVKGFRDGEILKVWYYHAQVIYDGQVCACTEEPAFQKLLRDQSKRVPELWGSRTHLMSHDEWRVAAWDKSCGGRSAGEVAARSAKFCTGLLKEGVPGGRILVWNDVFDPHHNAVKDYYLAKGSFEGSWEGLDPSVEIINWNFGKRDESLAFFAKSGHSQVVAGYYDEPLANVSAWLSSAAKVEGVKGFMYTTWKNDYSQLEAVAAILEKAGW